MVSILRMLKSRWWRFPITWWWRSLPLRVVLTVFVASVLVLVLGGFLLMQQATIGVIDGKKETAKSEARQAVNTAQQQLDAADLTGDVNVDKLLLDLATGFANRAGEQFEVIIIAPRPDDHRRERGSQQHSAAAAEAGRTEQRLADDPNRDRLPGHAALGRPALRRARP